MTMKILLADENSQRAGALSEILKADPSLEVIRLEGYESLISAVKTHVPDIVLVDICRADRDGLDSVRALSSSGLERPIALFVDEDDEALMEDAFAAGVCSYNVMDTPPRNVKPLLRSAIALYRRFQETTAELKAARQVLSDRETVDTAKKSSCATNAAARRKPIVGSDAGPCNRPAKWWMLPPITSGFIPRMMHHELCHQNRLAEAGR